MKVDIVTNDDIKIYYTGKFQDFTAWYEDNKTFITEYDYHVLDITCQAPGFVFTNYSQEYALSYFLSFFSKICKLECNTTSDWLKRMIYQPEVLLRSDAAKYRNIWRIRHRIF